MHSEEDYALIHKGHRQRMRAKMLRHGPAIFDTYELLEMLLYHSIPYKDTNPLAKKLLIRFGDLAGVFSATKEELLSVDGVGERTADLLLSLSELDLALSIELPSESVPVFEDYEVGGAYFVGYFEEHPEMKFAVTLLDNSMRAIDVIGYENPEFNSAAVNPRMIVDLAVGRNASAVLTAQNKYYSAPCALPSDRETVRMIKDTLAEIKVRYLEHYLVTGKAYGSARGAVDSGLVYSEAEALFEKSRQRALLAEGDGE